MTEPSLPSAVEVITQLVTGPSPCEVATRALQPALKALYPTLDIDPQLAMVVTPSWLIADDQVIAGASHSESLTDVLVRLGLSGTTVTYLEGEHFLTLQPGVPVSLQLPVKIDAIGALLNELAPLLFIAYKEQQVEYWDEFTSPGQPRWLQLSDALRNLWNVDASLGWDADLQAMAHRVFQQPDKRQRLPGDPYKTRTCLIDLDHSAEAERGHMARLDTAVLIGTAAERSLIISYSVINGFQRFDSLDEFADTLPRRFGRNSTSAELKWRLFEPDGNFFDHQACSLIALEADALGQINFFDGSTEYNLYPHAGTAGNYQQPTPRLKPHMERLQPLLPSWLNTASPADQSSYSRHLLDLTTVQHANNGKTFQSEVDSLQTFTRDALSRAMLKDHPTAADVNIDDIQVSITSVVVWGTFVLPGNTQTRTLSLLELALQNLAGLPLGNKTVSARDGSALPAWMSVAYLENLVSTVDIGRTYPAYLKARLVDDIAQAHTLQALYTRQLCIELPLLALQNKILGKAGIDEQGYRYVLAALGSTAGERRVDGLDIVIRPLAFVAHRSSSRADTVQNMFVIGPRVAGSGPCVLYRPLFETALLQYPGHANLLYAIQHSQHLRESVLAWLPDDVRFNYSQFVFTARLPSVWTIPQLLVNPVTPLDMSRPVELGTTLIENDALETLYASNVQALITQADRQSVSDAEARWATLKQGGWMLFNAALPFLGRSVGTAAWIWQIMDDLQEVSDVANQASGEVAWSALADILLALGMVLAHRAAVGDKPQTQSISAPEEPTQVPKPVPQALKPQRLPDVIDDDPLPPRETSLNTPAALKRSPTALASLLDRFKVTRPEDLGTPHSSGPYRSLYAHGTKWYAPVGQRWFEVQINDNEDIQVIDSRQQPPRAGPVLARTVNGQWIIDLRLRLRGGGLSRRQREARERRQAQAKALNTEIEAFDLTMPDKRTRLLAARAALQEALPEAREGQRQPYLDVLDAQSREYGAMIEKLKALELIEPEPAFRGLMIQRLEMQIFLILEWLNEHSATYQVSVKSTMDMMAANPDTESSAFILACERMTGQTQGIIEKMEAVESRLEELQRLGKEGVERVSKYRKGVPDYNLDNMKLLQISLGQEICVRPGTSAIHADARQMLEALIEDAALNIQSSLNLTTDESLTNLRERTEALSNLSEQFASVDQRFVDFAAEFPEQLDNDRLNHVRARTLEFKVRTDERLADLLRNKHLLEPIPDPSKPTASWSRKIIKTRFKGTLVGEPVTGTEADSAHLVAVRGELTGVIATFHEKSPGEWVEHLSPKPTPARTTPNLAKSVEAGQALIDGLALFRRRTEALINRAQRIPVEIEEIYHQHAARLRNAGEAIDEALTASNQTVDSKRPTQALGHALSEAATALYAKGTNARIQMIKQQPPTAARVEWLRHKNEVKITQTVKRRRLKGRAKDFLDEYEVRDAKAGKVLWYAHFHYAKGADAVGRFTAAHMKTVRQRRLGGAFYRQGNSTQDLIAIYRSEISNPLAQSLFFTPATPGAGASVPL